MDGREGVMPAGRMACEMGALPAAEAKKADGASIAVLLIPRPPLLMGRDACSQLASLSWMLQMDSIRDLWRPSKWSNGGDRKQGAVLRMYKSFGMAKVLRSKHRES